MTYKNTHNDPNQTKTGRSSEEVKAMLLGDSPTSDVPYDADAPLWEDHDGVRVVDMPHTPAVFKDDFGNPVLRCPTCGRARDCLCGDGCVYCLDGTPRRAAGEPERYAPASR